MARGRIGEPPQDSDARKFSGDVRKFSDQVSTETDFANPAITALYDAEPMNGAAPNVMHTVRYAVLDDSALSVDVRAARSRARCDRELSRLRARALRRDDALAAYADALGALAKAGAR